MDPLGEAKGIAEHVLQGSKQTPLQRERLESRLLAHPGGLTLACEVEHARMVKAKLTPDGWIVPSPSNEKLAMVFATAALLASKGDGIGAAVECQRLGDQAFKLLHTPHIVRGAESAGKAVGKQEGIAEGRQEGIAIGEEQARNEEARKRSANAKAAAGKKRKDFDAQLRRAYEAAVKKRNGRLGWGLMTEIQNQLAAEMKQIPDDKTIRLRLRELGLPTK